MANPVVHFEIMGAPDQKQALQDFYTKTFDWQIEPAGDMQYGMVVRPEDEQGISGAVDASEAGASVVLYIEVDGIRDFVERARHNGAEIVMDVMDVPGMITFAQFRDPAGNIVGIVDSKTPEPPQG